MTSVATRPGLAGTFFLGVVQILVWGGSFFLIAILGEPIIRDTGWSARWVYGSLSIGILISGLLAPLCGRLVSRYGGRFLLSCSGIVVALGLSIMATAGNLGVFILAWFIIGVGMAMGLYDTLFAALGNLYGQDARHTISRITLISGFCTTLVWPALSVLVGHFGWRHASLIYAVVLVVGVFPVYVRVLPKTTGAQEVAKGSTATGSPLDGGLYTLMTAAFTAAAVIMTAMSAHLIALLQGQGYTLAAAVGIGALIGPSAVASRVVEVLGKKRHPVATTMISVLLVAAGLFLMSLWPVAAAVGVVMYSAGNGLRAIVRGTLPLAIVPSGSYALVMGRMARPVLIGQAVTPMIGGYVLEKFGAAPMMWGAMCPGEPECVAGACTAQVRLRCPLAGC